MSELEEGQWKCPDCEWFSTEPKGAIRDNSERVHRQQLCIGYKRLRYSFDCKGRILEIRDGMIVVPYDQTRGGWYAVVVKATSEQDKKSYPRGGYNIAITDQDVETAKEHVIPDTFPVEDIMSTPAFPHEKGLSF